MKGPHVVSSSRDDLAGPLSATAQHLQRAQDLTLLVLWKDGNSKPKVWLMLQVSKFHTITKLKSCKLSHPKAGTIYVEALPHQSVKWPLFHSPQLPPVTTEAPKLPASASALPRSRNRRVNVNTRQPPGTCSSKRSLLIGTAGALPFLPPSWPCSEPAPSPGKVSPAPGPEGFSTAKKGLF